MGNNEQKPKSHWINGLIITMNVNGWNGVIKIIFSLILTFTSFFKLTTQNTVMLWTILLFNLPIVIDCSCLIPKLPNCINEDCFKVIHVITAIVMWLVIIVIAVAFGLSLDANNQIYKNILSIAKWFYFVNPIANILLLFYQVLLDRTAYKKFDY